MDFSRRNVLCGVVTSGLFSNSLRSASAQPASTYHAKYVGDLILAPQGDGRSMRVVQPYAYVDGQGRRWAVPPGAVVDGASIPRVLWTIVGGPFEGAYRNASVVHDWFCAVRTETSSATHRMFFEAMLTSHVSSWYAKLLYYGVSLGGPKWDDLTIANNRTASQKATTKTAGIGPATVLRPKNGNFDRNVITMREVLADEDMSPESIENLARDVRSLMTHPIRTGAVREHSPYFSQPLGSSPSADEVDYPS